MGKEVGKKDVWIFFVFGIPVILILFGLVDLFAGVIYDVAYRTSRGYDFVTAGIIVFAVELVMYAYLRYRGRLG
jgi:tetrahydromethanopterin S-methyltransferase subunit E